MRCDETRVWERLYSDYEEAQRLGHKVLGVFLQGSQNYNLDYEGSDIDTKCLIIPKFEDICLGKRMVSTTHILESGEHLDLKDIRDIMHQFKKQNINFLEILFTDHYILNPDYYELWKPMFDNRERIAHYDVITNMRATAGMCYEKFKAMTKDTPAQHEEIQEYGWASKQLHHCKRLNEFAKRYSNGESFEDCLFSRDCEELVYIKSKGHELYTLKEAVALGEKLYKVTFDICDKFVAQYDNEKVIDEEMSELMKNVTINILKKSLRKELME